MSSLLRLGAILVVAAATACGPEADPSDGGIGASASSTSNGSASGTSTTAPESTSGADTTASSTNGTTAGGPTAEECFILQSEEECEAAGCTHWSPARVVSTPSPDVCECGEVYDVCLLFEGESVGTGSFPTSWVFMSEAETVVELQRDYTSTPVGWTRCEDIVDPPAACSCFDGAAEHCDSQPGTTG